MLDRGQLPMKPNRLALVTGFSFMTLGLPSALLAEVTPSAETNAQVIAASEQLFAHLVSGDLDAQRAMMGEALRAMVTLDQLETMRDETARRLPTDLDYFVQLVTYYDQGSLVAAVDFIGASSELVDFSCGYLVWQVQRGRRPRIGPRGRKCGRRRCHAKHGRGRRRVHSARVALPCSGR